MNIDDLDLEIKNCRVVLASANSYINGVRAEFVKYVTDQSIPLRTRWEYWTEAPTYMHEAQPRIMGYVLGAHAFDQYFSNYAGSMMLSKGEKISIIELLSEPAESYLDNQEIDPWYGLSVAQAPKVMESVMARNISTFYYDW